MTAPDDGPPWIAASKSRAEELGLALTAAGIAYRIEPTAAGWRLDVDWSDRDRARHEIEAYARENPHVAREATSARLPFGSGAAVAAVLAALGLGAFYAHTGPRRPSMVWFRLGSADADAILAGEYWRVVTALTLHADAGHVLANAASCALFVGLLCRTVGPGIAVWLVLVAGALGNGATALAYGTHHSAVGASTGIFGAIGALAGLQFASRQRGARPRPWLPLAAGLALLAMLGSSPDADVAAHFFGFAAGAGAGLALGVRSAALPSAPGQSLLSLAAVAAIVACWGLAFGRLSISPGGPSPLG